MSDTDRLAPRAGGRIGLTSLLQGSVTVVSAKPRRMSRDGIPLRIVPKSTTTTAPASIAEKDSAPAVASSSAASGDTAAGTSSPGGRHRRKSLGKYSSPFSTPDGSPKASPKSSDTASATGAAGSTVAGGTAASPAAQGSVTAGARWAYAYEAAGASGSAASEASPNIASTASTASTAPTAPTASTAPTSSSPWTPIYDEQVKDYFYWHETTGESTWDLPEGVERPVNAPAKVHVADPEALKRRLSAISKGPSLLMRKKSSHVLLMPNGWQKYRSDELGVEYYVHENGTTAWELPTPTPEPWVEKGQGGQGGGEVDNDVHVVTSVDDELATGAVKEPAADGAAETTAEAAEEVVIRRWDSKEWQAYEHAHTRQMFYVHKITNESTWVDPRDDITPADTDSANTGSAEFAASTAAGGTGSGDADTKDSGDTPPSPATPSTVLSSAAAASAAGGAATEVVNAIDAAPAVRRIKKKGRPISTSRAKGKDSKEDEGNTVTLSLEWISLLREAGVSEEDMDNQRVLMKLNRILHAVCNVFKIVAKKAERKR